MKQCAGHFINKFDDCNYEFSFARPVEESKKTEDTRTHRNEKNVVDYTVHVEDASILTSDEYKFQLAAARAQATCKRLERTRGSDADPAWMAAEAQKIADKHPQIKEVRMITGKELVDHGMNLFWGVGRGARIPPVCVMIHY